MTYGGTEKPRQTKEPSRITHEQDGARYAGVTRYFIERLAETDLIKHGS